MPVVSFEKIYELGDNAILVCKHCQMRASSYAGRVEAMLCVQPTILHFACEASSYARQLHAHGLCQKRHQITLAVECHFEVTRLAISTGSIDETS